MMSFCRSSQVLIAVFFGVAFSATDAAEISFNRDIRTILSDNCFLCHGPDKSHRKAKLRLDDRENALEKEAIVPGKPELSALVKRILENDPEEIMPPPESNKKLTSRQKQLLQQWISQGARYEPHWAYAPLKAPEPPTVRESGWVRNLVDSYVLENLEAKNVQPSREADRRTLLRRLSLDLTGIPPTLREMAGFLTDTSTNAFERQVERLLASPHYGERMAVGWLDLVRFADTVGYHGDQNHNIFPYRDYVIRSFNSNKSFDQFTREQIAGDLLPNATTEQKVASGFNRLNMVTREGGAQPKEYLTKYTADRVRTISTAWLGSTMGCAECHDHKFDPFTAKDFYQMGAFFADIKQWGVYSDYKYTPNPDLKNWSNDHPFPPEIEVESDYLLQRHAGLQREINNLVASYKIPRADFQSWVRSSLKALEGGNDGWILPPFEVESKSSNSVLLGDGSILFKKSDSKEEEHKFLIKPENMTVAAIRIELLPHEENQGNILRSGESTTISLSVAQTGVGTSNETMLKFYHAEAARKETRYAHGQDVSGVADGWKTSALHLREPQSAVYLLDPPVTVVSTNQIVIRLKNPVVGRVRFSLSPFAAGNIADDLYSRRVADSLRGRKEDRLSSVALKEIFLISSGRDIKFFAQYKNLRRELLECRSGRAPTLITQAWEPRTNRVLPRGNWQDESGETVVPGTPGFLPKLKSGEGKRLNRRDLADWLMAPENPLTSRNVMNRLWKQFFGIGLSATVEDLGLQGDSPSHLELLDHLALEFQKSGWDIKAMVRLLVTSSTYRQISNQRQELRDLDPSNRWLSFQSPKRLEAEFVRDNALFAAGLLNLEMYGPSARPYQPAGYYANLQFPDREYAPHKDEQQYRRGIYMHWQRTFLHPMLANFDAPSREECTAGRTVSNTPQQALTLLNDPTFVEAARVFAEQLLALPKASDERRFEVAFQRALARPASPPEINSLQKFLQGQRSYFKSAPDDAAKLSKAGLRKSTWIGDRAELAAWTSVCRVILNLHEAITVY